MQDLYAKYDELSKRLDEQEKILKEITTSLEKSLDRKWIKEEKKFSIDYIQDIITKTEGLSEILNKEKSLLDESIKIDESFFVGRLKLSDAIYLLSKELSALKREFKGDFSNLYKK